MDTGIRDLSHIREHEDEGPTRRVGTILMAALATVGLVFAMGVLLGQGSDAAAASDPLAALERPTEEPLELGLAFDEESVEAPQAPDVEREALAFPETLTASYDVRPEVEAAVAAAAAELQHPEPIVRTHTGPAGDSVTEPPSMPAAEAMPPAAPPSTIADPLIAAAAMPAAQRSEAPSPAAAGHDGEYTLQVVSYQDRAEAAAFAEELRRKGHEAFVVTAEVEDRGVFHRVRIGPFENMREASEYRARFEADERMNTFVVRRRDDDDA